MGNNTNRGTCGGARPPVELDADALRTELQQAWEDRDHSIRGSEVIQRRLDEAVGLLERMMVEAPHGKNGYFDATLTIIAAFLAAQRKEPKPSDAT